MLEAMDRVEKVAKQMEVNEEVAVVEEAVVVRIQIVSITHSQ